MRMSERLQLTQFYDEGMDNQEIHPAAVSTINRECVQVC